MFFENPDIRGSKIVRLQVDTEMNPSEINGWIEDVLEKHHLP